MFNKWKNRKVARQLAAIGSHVDSQFVLYVNKEDAMYFTNKVDLLQYLSNYREINPIYSLKIYRVDTYSL